MIRISEAEKFLALGQRAAHAFLTDLELMISKTHGEYLSAPVGSPVKTNLAHILVALTDAYNVAVDKAYKGTFKYL